MMVNNIKLNDLLQILVHENACKIKRQHNCH